MAIPTRSANRPSESSAGEAHPDTTQGGQHRNMAPWAGLVPPAPGADHAPRIGHHGTIASPKARPGKGCAQARKGRQSVSASAP